ncbi:hypothetical protein [Ruminococcus sp.]
MATKHKNSDATKSQTPESNIQKLSTARASLLEATAMGIASALPFELLGTIRLDDNDGQEQTMIVF